ncbi:CDP-alcohol phosphatidyltransferase family protein [Phenylobacterium immobile]|uniref:CDP-alcohol phosphatidyltransferase family protein n=1 Tax=Phenylobacterium immobile TaxID=21 RepID=UPI000A8608B0|nr:CDP-alcohol phosphatidyltransferase family protein [Phenylobacterium immobile]
MTERTHQRLGSWLDALERPTLLWLAARLPLWITPNILTAIGFAGAGVTFVGYLLTPYTSYGLFLASVGFVINWFGDSLDGTLARYRRIARNRFGYFLDNGLDMVAQFLIAIGIGLSGVINWELCFLAFSILLMTSSLSYIRAGVSPVHKLAYGGVGLTEMRLVGVFLNTLIFFVPSQTFGVLPMTYPNLLFLLWSVGTFIVFVASFVGQLRELAKEDPRPERPE